MHHILSKKIDVKPLTTLNTLPKIKKRTIGKNLVLAATDVSKQLISQE